MIGQRIRFLLLAAFLLTSCQQQQQRQAGPPEPPVRSGEPIGLQVQRVDPDLKGERFRVLLDFETPADTAFVADEPGMRLDPRAAHTGVGSLALPAATRGITIKLSSLTAEQPFPGAWTLAGAYFYAQDPARVTVSYAPLRDVGSTASSGAAASQRTVSLAPGKWVPVMTDLTAFSDPNAPSDDAGTLRFEVQGASRAIWCDDVMVIDNTRYLVDAPASGDGWTVRRRGWVTTLDRPGQFKLDVPTPDAGAPDAAPNGAAGGWVVREASPLRVVFTSRDERHWWTVYSDGLQYRDGRIGAVDAADTSAAQQQHESPAELSVPDDMGRVDRSNPADRNNDGYAEMTGSYELQANHQPRFDVTLTPHTRVLVRPVLDVSRLPPGQVLVSMEGQAVESVARLPDGRVLVQLPGAIERPITVNFRVQ